MSARASSERSAMACSGAMYIGVPLAVMSPVSAAPGSLVSFTRPKSRTLAMSDSPPRTATNTLAGFRSRWTRPSAWASRTRADLTEQVDDPPGHPRVDLQPRPAALAEEHDA